MKKNFSIIIVAIAIISWSCEKEKSGPLDSSLIEPQIVSLSLIQQSFNLDDTTNSFIERLPNGRFAITDSLTIIVADGDGYRDISEASYRIYVPGVSRPLLQQRFSTSETISGSNDSIRFTSKFSLTLERVDLGTFRVEVFAKDKSGLVSNLSQTFFTVVVNNRAPFIGSPSFRYTIPADTDYTLFTVGVTASDSDGLGDIASVVIRPLQTPDSSIVTELYDDGDPAHSDQIAGDGIFSGTFWLDTLYLRSVEFEIVGIDKGGALSNIVRKSLNNHVPQILNLTVPDSIQIPTSGFNLFSFFMTVSDSDGLGDIDSVYFRNASSVNPNNKFLMYDDGNLALHGDSTANDGIYSIIVRIDPTNSPGIKEFHFYAVDKAGAIDERIKSIKTYN